MSKYRVASRFDKINETEKCPNCKNAFQDFIEFSEDLFGCFKCGTAFVPKRVRDAEFEGKRDQLDKQLSEMTDVFTDAKDPDGLRCSVCNKICKSKLGLMSHQRVHGIKP
jgi:hypothetical protein